MAAENQAKTSSVKWIFVLIILILVAAGTYFYKTKSTASAETVMSSYSEELVEVSYPTRMYQLEDGAYLRLGFSVLASEEDEGTIDELINDQSVAAVADGLHKILADKTQFELVGGTHRRQELALDIQKMLERRVLKPYNERQPDPEDRVRIREVLISEFVTQS